MRKTFEEYVSEGLDSVGNLIEKGLKKAGIEFKVTKKIGFIRYTIGDTKIVWDGVGIDVVKNNKSIFYKSGTPKLDYKDAIAKVQAPVSEAKKGMAILQSISTAMADGDEMVYLTFQDYDEDTPLEVDVELKDLNIEKIGNLVYNFYDDIGQLGYPLDVTKAQEKSIKDIMKQLKKIK